MVLGNTGGCSGMSSAHSSPRINMSPMDFGNGGIHADDISIGNTNLSGNANCTGGTSSQGVDISLPSDIGKMGGGMGGMGSMGEMAALMNLRS